jgi:hypothetical protein
LLAFRKFRGFSFLKGKLAGFRAGLELGNKGSATDYRDKLRHIFEASEKQILELQRAHGMDTFWRAYFWLLER